MALYTEDFFDEIEDIDDLSETYDDIHAHDPHGDAAKALADCINNFGVVDLNYMSAASGLMPDELIEALDGTIFQVPEQYDLHQSVDEDWVLREQYMIGNIRSKLDSAKRLSLKYGGRFDANVRLLESALPDTVSFDDIGISIGSSWIPERYYSAFAKEVLGLFIAPTVSYSKRLGQWKVIPSEIDRYAVNNIYTYGTMRMSALKIMEHTLNSSSLKIFDEVPRPDRKSGVAQVLNKTETLAVQEKQEALQQAFHEWILKSKLRMKELEQIFYDKFACNITDRFDGSFLTLPGINPEFVPFTHQRNAVARIILEKDVLLNHKVGSGKTNIIIIGVHERKRMGLSDRNLVVVPNNVLEAFERSHRYLYPDDDILVIRPEDFSPDQRQRVLERIRDDDHVAVYMAFSSFEMLPMSREFKLKSMEEEIRQLSAMIDASTEQWEKRRLQNLHSKACEAFNEMFSTLPFDKYTAFDELNITTLVIDEAHNFKNVTLNTKTDGIVGLHTKGSKKCNETLDKVQFVRKNGGGVIFSTGTPLTNSISDLYVMQLFLQPEQLRLLNLSRFDEWIGSFATRRTGFEIDVDSQNYRIMSRFSSFHNLPELTGLFANVCDFYNGDEGGLELPEFDGYTDTVVCKSREQIDYMEELALRAEIVRAKLVKATEDNLLKISHDGRAAALDIRLVAPNAMPDERGTKAYACAANVYKCYKENPGTAQLVFCDISTPKSAFNIYDEVKKHLIKMGIPRREIAFVHSANTDEKRRRLFDAVNRAKVRVLIGSTAKLGTGVNVQENLIAIHHLDVPWRPSDMTQREGRLIRQGNNCGKVFIYRYITAGTFDAYSWQILQNKQRFIGQFMRGDLADRDARDVDDTMLSYAEIKALCVGDPLLKTRIDAANRLERVRINLRQRDRELQKLKNIIDGCPAKLEQLSARKERLISDSEFFARSRETITRAERESFGEELLFSLESNVEQDSPRLFDCLHGFKIFLPANMKREKPYVLIRGITENEYEADMKDAKNFGCVQRIEYVLAHLGDRISSVDRAIERAREDYDRASAEFMKGNPYAAEADRLNEELIDIDEDLRRRAERSVA